VSAAPHSVSDKPNHAPSFGKRLVFAIFFAVIATGISFYVMTFGALFGGIGGGPNAGVGGSASLREVGLPVSIAVGVLVFAFTLRRKGAEQR
jgi:hypothetical protein